jgi:deoxycitidine kinase/deoxyguanosine kinase
MSNYHGYKVFSIEGNIGAGKTTIIELLKDKLINDENIIFVSEPLDMWQTIQDDNGVNMLTKFYENQDKYAFPFQVMAFATRILKMKNEMKKKPNAKIIICERSLEADYNIFAKMLHDDGKIETINYNVYLQFYELYKDEFPTKGLIYINANPETCQSRINKRNRTGEESIPIEYLQKCHKYHEDWIGNYEHKENMLTLDTEYNMNDICSETNLTYMDKWIKQIFNFVI